MAPSSPSLPAGQRVAAADRIASTSGPLVSGDRSDAGSEGCPFVNTDIGRTREEFLFRPPRWLDTWLMRQVNDPCDAPLVYLIFNVVCVTLPAAVLMFAVTSPRLGGLVGWKGHVLGAAYVIVNSALFLERFILCLHFSEHLPVFKRTGVGSVLQQLAPIFLCPLFGVPPSVYYLHHVIMHHCENNLFPYDLSSTEPFQRDNFIHFLFYYVRFQFAIYVELPLYAVMRRRYALAAKAVFCVTAYFLIVKLLFSISAIGTTWVLVVPVFLTSFVGMFGNWSQHIFINPANPRSNYSLTYNCVNVRGNMRTFNDGYHIIHHLNSKIRWNDLPHRFMASLSDHATNDALVFQNVHFMDVGMLVFTGQLNTLANMYVNIGQQQRSQQQLVAMMRERLRPIRPCTKAKRM